MTVYVGPGIRTWPAEAPTGTAWIATPPLAGAPHYPVVLDFAEAARSASPTSLIQKTCAVLAPTWEDFASYGLTATSGSPSLEQFDDINGNFIVHHYLVGAVARAIAALGRGHGIILRSPHRWDTGSLVFAQRMLREARLHDFDVAVEGPANLQRDSRFADLVKGAREVPRVRRGPPPPDPEDPANRLAALSRHGVPVEVLTKLGVGSLPASLPVWPGPSGERWAALPRPFARAIRSRIPPDAARELHGRLFDAWNPRGWGYLRRAGHAVSSGDPRRILVQHVPYTYGMIGPGLDFLYKHFVALARSPQDSPFNLQVFVGAARLAQRTRIPGASRRTESYYRRAIRLCSDPVDRIVLLFEAANFHALQKRPESLAEARRWYRRGWTALRRVPPGEARVRAEITLCNGQALVEYHERNNEAALALERRAMALTGRTTGNHSALERWSRPLLNTNTAKLLQLRFGDLPAAVRLLDEVVAMREPKVSQHAALNLARIHFDQGEFRQVAGLLAGLYEGSLPEQVDEHQETFGRALYTLSLLLLREPDRAEPQIDRLEYLCQMTGGQRAGELARALRRACRGEAGAGHANEGTATT